MERDRKKIGETLRAREKQKEKDRKTKGARERQKERERKTKGAKEIQIMKDREKEREQYKDGKKNNLSVNSKLTKIPMGRAKKRRGSKCPPPL